MRKLFGWYPALSMIRSIASPQEHVEGTSEPIRGSLTEYDEIGRVLSTSSVVGIEISLSGAGANQTTELDEEGTLLTENSTDYDTLGRIISTIDSYGRETQTTYNRYGNVTQTRRESVDEDGEMVWMVSRTL